MRLSDDWVSTQHFPSHNDKLLMNGMAQISSSYLGPRPQIYVHDLFGDNFERVEKRCKGNLRWRVLIADYHHCFALGTGKSRKFQAIANCADVSFIRMKKIY